MDKGLIDGRSCVPAVTPQAANLKKAILTCGMEYGSEGTRLQEGDKIKGYCISLGKRS